MVKYSSTPIDESSILWRLKVKLQFTGWLQFIPNAILCLALAVISLVCAFFSAIAFWLFALLSGALLANLIFDIVTVKYKLHPLEPIPAPLDELDDFDVMRARRACRAFQRRDLTAAHRDSILKLAKEVTAQENCLFDKDIRLSYISTPLRVWPVIGAHEFLVAIAPATYDPLAVINVGHSLQKLVIEATRMGLATCWIGPGADHASVIETLGDRFNPARDHIICVCAIGYKSRYKPLTLRLIQRFQNNRLPLTDLFFTDQNFSQSVPIKSAPFNKYGRCYEVCQWSPSSYNAQPTRAVVRTNDVNTDIKGIDFFAATSSRYYAVVALGIWCANWETGAKALGQSGEFRVLDQINKTPSTTLPRYYVSWQPHDTRMP